MKHLLHVFITVKKESPKLYWIVIIMFFGAIGSLLGLIIDKRTVMGVNVWLKPLKFFISTGIYIFTVGYLIMFYPYSNRKKHIIRNLVSWSLLLEMGIITVQAARGVQSHYNMATLTDGFLFGIMGILILINVLIMLLFAIDTIRLKLKAPKSIQYAILLGWLIIIFGSWVGNLMIGQLAHNIGVKDGGEGLHFFNWSTVAGDLRVAHFFGLHSIQILPLLGYWVYKKLKLKDNTQVLLIMLFALIFATFIFFTYYQASKGIAFIQNLGIII